MTLPDPEHGPPSDLSSTDSSSSGAIPLAPIQRQCCDGSMPNWLGVKVEEEKRRQEEEQTRQETLKLEQRKIEHMMLRECMQGGIPPHLVPVIFAGTGCAHFANMSAEWVQQYTTQVQSVHQHAQAQTWAEAQAQAQAQLSPELRRDPRVFSQQTHKVHPEQPPASRTVLQPSTVLPGQPPLQLQHGSSAYAGERTARATCHPGFPAYTSHTARRSQLPNSATSEMHTQQAFPAQCSAQQLQGEDAQEQSSPSIYFHHWVPPSSQ